MAVGAYDLPASMGHPGEPWREDVQAVVRQIREGCQLITVGTLEWGIQATQDAGAELAALAPTRP